jgi:hypothetical protein
MGYVELNVLSFSSCIAVTNLCIIGLFLCLALFAALKQSSTRHFVVA